MLFILSLGLALVAGDTIDRLARPGRRPVSPGLTALAMRGGALVWLWGAAMALSQRPLYSAFATAVTVAVLVVISNEKQKALREPLVFSDFAFIGAVVRYPHLFYLEARTIVLILAGIVVAVLVTAAWWHVEPSAMSVTGEGLTVAALLGLSASVFVPRVGAGVAARLPSPAQDAHLPTLGLLGSLLAYWIAWRHRARRPIADPAPVDGTPPYEAIVVIQAESFVDMRRHGMDGLRLPAYDALKARALASGLLDVPCFGAYTLRPEMAVLTGLGFEQAGFDAFHPYLRGERFAALAIPNRLPATWRGYFIHPFHRSFFRRDRVVAAFGFDSFVDDGAFERSDRVGPYVGDLAVARHLIGLAAAARREGIRPFVHVVTMEAHDPYLPGRIAGASTPTAQYLHHLANADRMLALIADDFDRDWDRVLLVHYGDHAPLLPDKPGAFADARTDFLVVELGRGARSAGGGRPCTRPEDLHAVILDQFAGGRPAS